MTSIIRCLDVEIENPKLKPVYVPFVAEPGLIAGWRFGSGMNDLSGNGNTLTAIGAPTSDNFFISGDKDNGFMTTVPDGLQRTLVAIWRNHSTTDAYGYPVGNLRQSSSVTGIGFGLISSSSSSSAISRVSGLIGNRAMTDNLIGSAAGPSEPYASRLNFRFAALSLDSAGNVANLYLPGVNPELIPATVSALLSNRSIQESGEMISKYRLIAYRDPTAPSVAGSAIDVAEALIFDRPLDLPALQRTYARSKNYMAMYGQVI